jgi:hypothetical protein
MNASHQACNIASHLFVTVRLGMFIHDSLNLNFMMNLDLNKADRILFTSKPRIALPSFFERNVNSEQGSGEG